MTSEIQHNVEIQQNLIHWNKKPVLQEIYKQFYSLITQEINLKINGEIVELGSGIGNLKSSVPQAICTDLFDNPWIDKVENAYALSFGDNSVSNLILFDVFHHLQYPGNALREFYRVLNKKGRVIIFEPGMSLLGLIAYGVVHHEPIGLWNKICWDAPEHWQPNDGQYYAAQGNAHRIFFGRSYLKLLDRWQLVRKTKITSMAYLLSGGYGKKQLYPDSWFPFMQKMDKLFTLFKPVFTTRLLIVLEKND
jgi:SAM-dependent methyltransferase